LGRDVVRSAAMIIQKYLIEDWRIVILYLADAEDFDII